MKALILMRFDESGKSFNASACGDNCAKWIFEISKIRDLTINLHHVMDFGSCEGFEAYIENTGTKVNGYCEYLDTWLPHEFW